LARCKQHNRIYKGVPLSHGHCVNGQDSPTYRSWYNLLSRCTNANHNSYERYGGRGITVCERWQGKGGFQNFLEDMGPRPLGKTIDREDNDGNYEPGNCRWATKEEQTVNQRPRKKKYGSMPGCYFKPRLKSKPWLAMIYTKDRNFYIGYFATEEEAAEAVRAHVSSKEPS
jgi:hypothetical protein